MNATLNRNYIRWLRAFLECLREHRPHSLIITHPMQLHLFTTTEE